MMPVVSWNMPARSQQPPEQPVPPSQSVGVRWATEVIAVVSFGQRFTVAAQVLGPLALFRSPTVKGKHALIHRATGCRLAWMTVEQNLRRMAELLTRELPQLMTLTDREEINRRRPLWVRQWTRACEEQDVWIDPQLFKEQA